MLIDTSTDATTMSMTRKGRTIGKPISKARSSSEIMKAGTGTFRGVAAGAVLARS
jgi:hypothetical protein